MVQINQRAYRIALASAGITQVRLAQKLGVAPSTLSGWVTGAASPPDGWLDRLEDSLAVPLGALRHAATEQGTTP